jgi:hypothetical protein
MCPEPVEGQNKALRQAVALTSTYTVQWLIESRPPPIANPIMSKLQYPMIDASGSAWSRHAGPRGSDPGYRMLRSGVPRLHWL